MFFLCLVDMREKKRNKSEGKKNARAYFLLLEWKIAANIFYFWRSTKLHFIPTSFHPLFTSSEAKIINISFFPSPSLCKPNKGNISIFFSFIFSLLIPKQILEKHFFSLSLAFPFSYSFFSFPSPKLQPNKCKRAWIRFSNSTPFWSRFA